MRRKRVVNAVWWVAVVTALGLGLIALSGTVEATAAAGKADYKIFRFSTVEMGVTCIDGSQPELRWYHTMLVVTCEE